MKKKVLLLGLLIAPLGMSIVACKKTPSENQNPPVDNGKWTQIKRHL